MFKKDTILFATIMDDIGLSHALDYIKQNGYTRDEVAILPENDMYIIVTKKALK